MPITLTRALLVILIPGGVSLSSWGFLILLGIDGGEANSIYETYTAPINATFFAAIVILGTVIEGLNTHLEVMWDKERNESLKVYENWYAYLCHILPNEPVAFKYISRLVTMLYFELGMMWASVLFGTGIAAIFCTIKPNNFQLWSSLVIIVSLAALFYFKWQAKNTHKVLCKTRIKLNDHISANRVAEGL